MSQTPEPAAVGIDGSTAEERQAGAVRWAIIIGTLFGVALVVHQLFNLRLGGMVLIEVRYLNLLGGLFLGISFLVFRAAGERRARHRCSTGCSVPWPWRPRAT